MIDAFAKLARLIGGVLPDRGDAFSDYEAGDYLTGSMESDGPDATKPAPVDARIRALAELSDSELIRVAAAVIAGWKPILLKTTGDTVGADVDVLVAALRDRAAQFEAVEADAGAPVLTLAHLNRSVRTRSE